MKREGNTVFLSVFPLFTVQNSQILEYLKFLSYFYNSKNKASVFKKSSIFFR